MKSGDLGLANTEVCEEASRRLTCRCGVMFFNDTGLVMSEALSVL